MEKPRVLKRADILYASRKRRMFQRSLALGTVLLTLATFVVVYILWGESFVDFFSDPSNIRDMVARNPLKSRLLFFFANFIQVVIAIMPGEPFELAAGYAFGAVEGTLICMAAVYAASIPIFLLVKRYGRPVIELFFEPEKIDEVKLFQKPGRLNALMFILMFVPGTPKDILTYLAGLTPMKLSTWLLVVSARILSVVTSTVSGGLIGSQNYLFAITVFLVTAFIALLGIFLYRRLNREACEDEERRGKHNCKP